MEPYLIKDQITITTATKANFKKYYAHAVRGNININDPKIHYLRKPSETKI